MAEIIEQPAVNKKLRELQKRVNDHDAIIRRLETNYLNTNKRVMALSKKVDQSTTVLEE